MTDSDGILLNGLDGSNPLAFLAALGTLRTLTLALPNERIRMSWEQYDGAWRPRVWCSLAGNHELFIAGLAPRLPTTLPQPWAVDKRLPFAASLLRELMRDAAHACSMNDRSAADLLAAFGSDAFSDDKANFADTLFRMVRSGDSAGQGLLHYACRNAASVTEQDLRICLFGRWVYEDRGSSFRWDPTEDKMYALQANDPSDDGSLSVMGANRLALEALVLFPVQPTRTGAATTGFVRSSRRADWEFHWPIWTVPLSIDVIGSLLTRSFTFGGSTVDVRRNLGVAAMFKSRQFKPNKYYRNFSPAQAV